MVNGSSCNRIIIVWDCKASTGSAPMVVVQGTQSGRAIKSLWWGLVASVEPAAIYWPPTSVLLRVPCLSIDWGRSHPTACALRGLPPTVSKPCLSKFLSIPCPFAQDFKPEVRLIPSCFRALIGWPDSWGTSAPIESAASWRASIWLTNLTVVQQRFWRWVFHLATSGKGKCCGWYENNPSCWPVEGSLRWRRCSPSEVTLIKIFWPCSWLFAHLPGLNLTIAVHCWNR